MEDFPTAQQAREGIAISHGQPLEQFIAREMTPTSPLAKVDSLDAAINQMSLSIETLENKLHPIRVTASEAPEPDKVASIPPPESELAATIEKQTQRVWLLNQQLSRIIREVDL